MQRNELPKILKESEELFYGTLGTCKTDPLYFKLKEDLKLICSTPFPVLKVHKKCLKMNLNN